MATYPGPFSGHQIRSWLRDNLPDYPLSGPDLPESVQDVVRLGAFLSDPDCVVLYGSRARNDARTDSDFDFAFFGIRSGLGFRRLIADVADEPITLRPIDLLDIEEASPELRYNVEREGVVIYERSAQAESKLS